MFKEFRTQKIIFAAWVILLFLFFSCMQIALWSKSEILQQIDLLEQDLKTEQWENAVKDVEKIKDQWESRKYINYMANETENLRTFEKKLIQFEFLVRNQEDDSLEMLPEIRETVKDFLNVF
ncbi:MAG: DUF4363 family protein [Peptococcaceae bacterium]|nr:DUF4363 family protein [Peptococcaceae bacterium]